MDATILTLFCLHCEREVHTDVQCSSEPVRELGRSILPLQYRIREPKGPGGSQEKVWKYNKNIIISQS